MFKDKIKQIKRVIDNVDKAIDNTSIPEYVLIDYIQRELGINWHDFCRK